MKSFRAADGAVSFATGSLVGRSLYKVVRLSSQLVAELWVYQSVLSFQRVLVCEFSSDSARGAERRFRYNLNAGAAN